VAGGDRDRRAAADAPAVPARDLALTDLVGPIGDSAAWLIRELTKLRGLTPLTGLWDYLALQVEPYDPLKQRWRVGCGLVYRV